MKKDFDTRIIKCVAVAVLLTFSRSASSWAQNAFPDPSKWYYITSYISGLNLDVYSANCNIGGRITQANLDPNQVWQLTPAPGHPNLASSGKFVGNWRVKTAVD
ncbi:MAG TPA: hypothetical protein VIX19_06750 [Terriglobales bacterium]